MTIDGALLATLLGMASSVFSEAASALNKKLSGTPLKGQAAFIIVLLASMIGAEVKVISSGVDWTDWHALLATFPQVFTISQIYYYSITKFLKMDTQSPNVDPAKLG